MAGLLDWMQQNPALTQGLLGGAFGLLGSRGTRLQAIGQGGMAGLNAYANAKQDETQNKFRDLQTQALQGQVEQQRLDQQRAQQLRALPGQFMRSPAQQALAGGGGPTVANAQKMDGAQSAFDIAGYTDALMAIDPVQAIQLKAAMRKESTPLKLSQGEVAIDPQTGKQLFANPKAPDLPNAVQEYQFAVGQGYKGSFDQWDQARRRAGATNVNVPVNTNKPFLTTMAEQLGKQVSEGFDTAKAAESTIGTAQNIQRLVSGGKVITGPGADARMFGLQLGEALGVTGKDAKERLQNTRSVIQSLAQSELDAAAQMKGQGQITESERSILRRAAAGEISFTAPELNTVAKTLETRARKRISAHQENVKRLGQMPDASKLVPFYSVDMPPELKPSAQPSGGYRILGVEGQ